jgi:hypothetical protein
MAASKILGGGQFEEQDAADTPKRWGNGHLQNMEDRKADSLQNEWGRGCSHNNGLGRIKRYGRRSLWTAFLPTGIWVEGGDIAFIIEAVGGGAAAFRTIAVGGEGVGGQDLVVNM